MIRTATYDDLAGLFSPGKSLRNSKAPCISELRANDGKLITRNIWELDTRDHAEACGYGVGNPDGDGPTIIRFGSQLEQLIYTGMQLLALAELTFVPFIISFDSIYPLRTSMVVLATDLVMTTLLMMGVGVRFRTSFIDSGDIAEVKDPDDIRKGVLSDGSFWVESLGIAAAPLLYAPAPLHFLSLLRLAVCFRLTGSTQRQMLLTYGYTGNLDVLRKLRNVTIGVLECAHILGCIWFVAKRWSPTGRGNEWSAWSGWSPDVFTTDDEALGALSVPIGEYGDLDNLLWCYARSLRDGVYMLAGWGGPNAISSIELGFICVLGPMSSCIMAYVQGTFVTTIQQATILQGLFAQRAAILTSACKDMHLDPCLMQRIVRYHSYLSMHHLGPDAQELFTQLSVNLESEMKIFRIRDILESSAMFRGLDGRTILLLVQTCTQHVFSPGDFVVRKGEIADCMYIVLRGTLAVLVSDDREECVRRMYEGDCFGEICFLKASVQRTAWVRADTFVVLMRLDKERFDSLLGEETDIRQQVLSGLVKRDQNYVGLQEMQTSYHETVRRLSNDVATEVAGKLAEECRTISTNDGVDGWPRLKAHDHWGDDANESTPLVSRREGTEHGKRIRHQCSADSWENSSVLMRPTASLPPLTGSIPLMGPLRDGLHRYASRNSSHESRNFSHELRRASPDSLAASSPAQPPQTAEPATQEARCAKEAWEAAQMQLADLQGEIGAAFQAQSSAIQRLEKQNSHMQEQLTLVLAAMRLMQVRDEAQPPKINSRDSTAQVSVGRDGNSPQDLFTGEARNSGDSEPSLHNAEWNA